jgi:hypothetical protein
MVRHEAAAQGPFRPFPHIDAGKCLPYKPRQSRRLAGGPERLRPLTSLKFSVRSGDQPRETDLSAEQTGAQAPPRLSHPDGDQGRPQGFGGAPFAWPQATERLNGGVGRLFAAAPSKTEPLKPNPWSA